MKATYKLEGPMTLDGIITWLETIQKERNDWVVQSINAETTAAPSKNWVGEKVHDARHFLHITVEDD